MGLKYLVVAVLFSGGALGANAQTFDPNTVETVSGTVTLVETVTETRGGADAGVHVMLALGEEETVAVHLGPAWYLDSKKLTVEIGDTLEIKGSRITFEDEAVIIAQHVKKGDLLVVLRGPDGVPKWRGRPQS